MLSSSLTTGVESHQMRATRLATEVFLLHWKDYVKLTLFNSYLGCKCMEQLYHLLLCLCYTSSVFLF